MLARGWLAYPVASMHAQLPPKSGCICKHIPRFTNPMTPTQTQSPCKQLLQPLFGGRFPPSTTNPREASQPGATIIQPSFGGCHPPSIGLRIVIEKIAPPGAMYHKKTAEERFHMLARGWLAYPVTSMHSQLPPKSGCRKRPRRRHCEAQNAAERVPQRGSISAAHSGISEQYRFANIPSVVR